MMEDFRVASIVVVVDGGCADDNNHSLFRSFSQISKLMPPIKDSIQSLHGTRDDLVIAG